jgi:hypothetical protein
MAPERHGANAEYDATAFSTQTTESTESAAGTMIGPCRLLQLIGEGGMGQVWLASKSNRRAAAWPSS